MKALLIGGTGTISLSIAERCVRQGWELYLLNRGTKSALAPMGAQIIAADMNNEEEVRAKLNGMHFDVVAQFIAYEKEQVLRDVELFEGKTDQYIFISSASAYQKPLSYPFVTEGTPLCNPFWQYSRDKIVCEEALMEANRNAGFPVTIVRPSHTYGKRGIPVALHGKNGSFAVVDRIRRGKKVIVPGDGLNLWTLTHSDDFAVAFCGLMGNVHAIGEVFQITGDERLTWNQVHGLIGRALGVEARLTHIASDALAAACPEYRGSLLGDKSNNAIFDCAKVKAVVPEFNAAIRFDQGVRQAVEYIYSHPECQRPDPAFDSWCDAMIGAYEKAVATLPAYSME